MTLMSDEDRQLDALWRQAFGEPLPILDAAPIVRAVLAARAPADPSDPPVARAA